MAIIYFFIIILFSEPLFAYIDPGTGSAIISAIIGVFAAIIWNIKKIWFKIKKLFKKNNK